MVLISTLPNSLRLPTLEQRRPKGIGISPYPFRSLIRYFLNALFNGWFSYLNPDRQRMKLLAREGCITHVDSTESSISSFKVVFLGDIMVSRSGKPPQFTTDLKKVLEGADVIVANLESPVVDDAKIIRRGLSLNFAMNRSFLSTICACNRTAKWVFSIANNHVCDTSQKSTVDVSGVEATINHIRIAVPGAEVIGAEIGAAKSVLSLQIDKGPKVGIVGWTEVMNRDKKHYKKPIIRETDLTDAKMIQIKEAHDLLIGFAHGNEEQSYYPLKKTRERWMRLIDGKKFDFIVGHGPHVLQPAEKVGSQGLLFHSIGNFCSPLGKSQTKIGCIPEMTISHIDGKVSRTDYKVHILQQHQETLSLNQDLKQNSQRYPGQIRRLKKIWKPLFEAQES